MYLTQSDINTVGTTYRVILCLLVLHSTHPREFSHPATKHSNVFDPDPNTHFFHGNKNTDTQGGAKRGPQTHDHNAVKSVNL